MRESGRGEENWREEILKDLGKLHPQEVIRACGRVREDLSSVENRKRILEMLSAGGLAEEEAKSRMESAFLALSPECLEERMKREFGPEWVEEFSPGLSDWEAGKTGCFEENGRRYRQKWRPLGVLFHIGAGNMDGISAFSTLEGLLTGNINLVKLPGGGDPVSRWLVERLFEAEPKLRRYLRLFPVSSAELDAMRELADAADGIVVWGGDEAVQAVRRLADPGARLIEWGNRLSFAYVPAAALHGPEEELAAQLKLLARHVAETDQLLCSSCQGVYVDTEKGSDLMRVGRLFLAALERELGRRRRGSFREGDGLELLRRQALLALEVRTAQLESIRGEKRVLRGDGCSVTVFRDSCLEPSLQYGNPWVRPLPSGQVLSGLRPYRGRLQTVSILCQDRAEEELRETFFRAGAVRITAPDRMSSGYSGESHDGEMPLRRYVKRISVEMAL